MLKENIMANFHDLEFGHGFFNVTPKVQVTREKINWFSLKLTTFVHQR